MKPIIARVCWVWFPCSVLSTASPPPGCLLTEVSQKKSRLIVHCTILHNPEQSCTILTQMCRQLPDTKRQVFQFICFVKPTKLSPPPLWVSLHNHSGKTAFDCRRSSWSGFKELKRQTESLSSNRCSFSSPCLPPLIVSHNKKYLLPNGLTSS